MATIAWPATLPNFQDPLFNSYSEQQGSTTIRSSVSVGPPKTRQRTTASIDTLEVGYVMDSTQLETFVTFFETTSRHGALRFDATHPRTNNLVEVKFSDQPSYEPFAPNKYKVSFTVQVMP